VADEAAGEVCVDLRFERHGQGRERRQQHPSPGVEFRAGVEVEADLGILAEEAEGEPLLPLAAIPAAERLAEQMRW
jgi:hypothetical protein